MRFVRTAENLFGLPLGFTRVEYLESSGTQYIDTGYIPKPTSTYKSTFQLTNIATTAGAWFCVFGSVESNNVVFTELFLTRASGGGNVNQILAGNHNSSYVRVNYPWAVNTKYSFEMTPTEVLVNGVSQGSISVDTSITCSRPIYLFARHEYTDAVGYNVSAKIHSFTIYEGNTLVRDFIPCIDPLGVPCMYDLVGKKPYYNLGTGIFTVGRQIIPVEYLESNGTQYIDTGVVGDLTTELTCEAAIVQAGNASVTNIMGNNVTSTRAITINMSANIANPSPSRIRFGNTDNTTEAGAIDLNTFYKYDTNKNGLTVRDVSGTVLNTYALNATTAFTTNGNILIFKLGDTSTQYIGKIKVKGATIKNSGVLVRDFIPCKDENNVGFMFDKVSGTVYLNAGTGAFSFGEPVYTSKLRLIKDAVLLPDGYKRVDYLESTGTQYIDTEYTINTSTDEVEAYFQLITTDKYKWLMGEHDNGARFGIGSGDGTNLRNIAYGASTYKVNDTEVYNSQHYFNANSNGVYVNGTQVKTFESFTSTSTIYLFNLNISGGGNGAAGKIWSYKHKRNGVLIRDFVPCLDKNNVPCMVDLVSGGTYYNQGTGSFSYGHIITPVEYLESTGTQFIDTGIANAYDIRLVTSVSIEEANYGNDTIILGGRNQNTPGGGFCIRATGNAFDNDYYGTRVKVIDFSYNTWYEIDKNKNSCTINGTTVSNTQSTSVGTQTILLNGYTNNDGSKVVYQKGNVKWKFCKIYKNDVLVRSFIPVRDENNVGYMFDEVTGQLFSNASSGSFVIGNDLPKPKVRFIQDVIPSAYLPLKYLQSTGTQYIDLGVGVKANTVFKATFSIASTATGRSYFGARNSTNERFQIVNSIGIGGGYYLSNTVYPLANQKYEIEMHANGDMYLDGVKRSASTGTFSQVAFGRNLWLFATNYYDSSVGPGASTFWSAIIYEGNVPVRDLYPALRKSDNKPGMYDRITKQFFVNQGTGEFNYG